MVLPVPEHALHAAEGGVLLVAVLQARHALAGQRNQIVSKVLSKNAALRAAHRANAVSVPGHQEVALGELQFVVGLLGNSNVGLDDDILDRLVNSAENLRVIPS